MLQGGLVMLMQKLPTQKVMKLIILLMMQTNLVKKEVEIAVPLKYLSSFWRTLDVPLINCEVPLILTWSRECGLTSMERKVVTNTRRDTSLTNATFQITDTKLYVPVVTLSTENDKRLLEQLRTGFKRTIKWNKYRSEMTNQTKNNNLNYLIDPTFTKVNRLFVLSFENENDRISFSKYDVPNVQIKDFNLLIDGKGFFDIPIKMEKKHTNKLSKWEETMITRQAICWIMSTFQSITNYLQ